jgi:hypothetical protein
MGDIEYGSSDSLLMLSNSVTPPTSPSYDYDALLSASNVFYSSPSMDTDVLETTFIGGERSDDGVEMGEGMTEGRQNVFNREVAHQRQQRSKSTGSGNSGVVKKVDVAGGLVHLGDTLANGMISAARISAGTSNSTDALVLAMEKSQASILARFDDNQRVNQALLESIEDGKNTNKALLEFMKTRM